MFWCVSYYLGAFGTVWMPYKTWFKMSRSGEKFVPRSRVGTFRNERNRSTPVDSKIMFWCGLYYLDAFETVWLSYKSQCKTGRSGAKVRAILFGCVSYYLGAFGTVCCVTTLSSKPAKLVQMFVPQSR